MDRATFEQELRVVVADGRQSAVLRLSSMVGLLRPAVASDVGHAHACFGYLAELLEEDTLLAGQVATLLFDVLNGYSSEKLFAESGIVSIRSFWPDLRAKLSRKLLPEYYPDDDARSLLHQVFSHRTDYIWLAALSRDDWHRFMAVLRLSEEPLQHSGLESAISHSLIVLAQRITAIAYEPEI